MRPVLRTRAGAAGGGHLARHAGLHGHRRDYGRRLPSRARTVVRKMRVTSDDASTPAHVKVACRVHMRRAWPWGQHAAVSDSVCDFRFEELLLPGSCSWATQQRIESRRCASTSRAISRVARHAARAPQPPFGFAFPSPARQRPPRDTDPRSDTSLTEILMSGDTVGPTYTFTFTDYTTLGSYTLLAGFTVRHPLTRYFCSHSHFC